MIRPKACIVPVPSSEYAWWIFLAHQHPLTYISRARPAAKIAETTNARNDPTQIKTAIMYMKSSNSSALVDGGAIAFLLEPDEAKSSFRCRGLGCGYFDEATEI